MSAYGSAFRSEWPTLVVTLLVAGILAIQIPAWQAIAAAGRMWAALGMNVVWALLYLGLAWAMISFGSLGVATAQLLAYLVYAVMSLTFALKVSRAPASSGSPVSDRG
jgi:O-antigen/teichoic acid export membrane protein